jgi:aminoglycoside phosphotransferase (APT) family kinase protein
VSSVPPGIDPEAVGRLIGQTDLQAEMLSRGRSNLTYRVWNDHGEWVVRRPPLGHVLATAHDMAREYRVLTALRDTPVAVPVTVALCDDESTMGAPFYVMTMVHGLVVGNDPPQGYADGEDGRRRLMEGFVETLAALHAVDWQAVGLEGFGRPEGYLERQVKRWAKQWEGNKTRELPAIEELRHRLETRVPPQSGSTIVHGDYSLNNVMMDRDDPSRVAAVLDWEMSTLGDPLADIGWVMAFWPTGSSFPSVGDVADYYSKVSGRSVEHVGFYVALANYKMAVIGEGIHARYLKGATVGEGFDEIGASVPQRVEAGLAALRG